MEENKEASTLPVPIARTRGEGSRRVFPANRSSPSPSLPQQFLFTPVERANFPVSFRAARSLDEEDNSLALFLNETRQHRAVETFKPKMNVGSPTSGGSSGSNSIMERKKSIQQMALERYKGMQASFSVGASSSGSKLDEEEGGGGEVLSAVNGKKEDLDEDLLFQMSELDAQ
jgi:hypothetical protein